MGKLVVGILAHVDAGKTTLSEALLYQSGALRRLGRVDHQDAFLDTDAMERERKRREQVAFSLDSGQAEKLSGEDTVETHSARQNLRSFFAVLLALLTPEEKAVFTAYFLEQQTMRDIAAAQQLTENQVKAVIRRIRRRAKTLFEENFS